jgi:radical SAM family uncharacterized protein
LSFNNEFNSQLLKILPAVQKPGRYVGGEYNSVVKEWHSVPVHFGLVFPDIYDLGVPNLGLAILYQTLNGRDDVLAERAFSPWLDMEEALRKENLPLYSLENKRPLIDFDLIGFTLPYETLYTNALNILDLAGIPIFSKDRTDHHPLIIAGGHAAFNPEPMADFIDVFVIGEGEEVIHEIVDTYKNWKSLETNRHALLKMMSKIPGIYVPSFYQPKYDSSGAIVNIKYLEEDVPHKINKRIIGKLPDPPTNFIVPSIDVVHNRVAIEIMRGCTRGCRFCHAGMINRPVRERSVESIVNAIESALDQTGFEEVALLSLSSSDYSHISELIQAIGQKFEGRNLTISLPSLRIESFSVDIIEQLQGSRQGGFTLAPEAATDRMRNIINKPIPSEQLLETAREIYSRGWQTIKLYFMIGHPSETLEDVQAIADLCKQVLKVGQQIIGKRANLHAGVSTFVPKPHTPFQWVPCDQIDQIKEKQALLRKELRGQGLKLNWTSPEETMLEAWLSRGDRRLGQVIYQAWKLGAKFDAWQDQRHADAWQKAFSDVGLDPEFYTHRERKIDETLPWDIISTGVRKSYLIEEYENSRNEILRNDCRLECHTCGILPEYNHLRFENPGELWKCPEIIRLPKSTMSVI